MSIYKNGQKVLGNFNDVTGFVEKSDITTTINSASTDSQVPSAKSVWDSLYKICDPQILEDANKPTSRICEANFTTLNTPSKEGLTSAEASLIISINNNETWNGQISITMADPTVYVRSVGSDTTWTKWRKLCTTRVADVPLTDITSKLKNCSKGTIGYSVKDGICRVKINGLKPNTQSVEILATGILPNPDPIHNGHFNVMYTTGNMALFIIYNSSTDGVVLRSCNSIDSGDIFCTLEYPVK